MQKKLWILGAALSLFTAIPASALKVYRATSEGLADVKVYVTTSEGLADCIIYVETSEGLAKGNARWYYETSEGLADVKIYFTDSEGLADKKIYYTKSEGLARCKVDWTSYKKREAGLPRFDAPVPQREVAKSIQSSDFQRGRLLSPRSVHLLNDSLNSAEWYLHFGVFAPNPERSFLTTPTCEQFIVSAREKASSSSGLSSEP